MEVTWLWLVVGSIAAGVVNAVAGGGALILYPLLLGMGISPVSANATMSMVAWPSAISSAYGYRHHLRTIPHMYLWLLAPCIVGGGVGAVILRHTEQQAFSVVVPWFILLAVGLLSIQPLVHTWLHSRRYLQLKQHHRAALYGIVGLGLFAVSIYGGYFGAGFGIIMLAFLGLTAIRDIQQLNGLKNLASIGINVVACILFIRYGFIDWQVLPFCLAGGMLGGWLGAHFSSRLPAHFIRSAIVVIGLVVAGVLFSRG